MNMFNILNDLFKKKQKDKSLTQLHTEAVNGNLNSIKILLQKGLDVNVETVKHHVTPLDFAVWKNHLEVVEFLIAHRADINHKSAFGFTPLSVASYHGHLDIVISLIENGADLNTTTVELDTPLHLAAEKGYLNVVNVLIDKGLNVNAENCYQITPLHRACYAVGNENWAPLLYCAFIDCLFNLVKNLVDKGANIKAKTSDDGRTALHFATEKNYLKIVDFLLKNKAEVNALDNRKWTPLHYAVQLRDSAIVKTLINNGADVNARSKDNFTPLKLGVIGGIIDVVKLLIINGACFDEPHIDECVVKDIHSFYTIRFLKVIQKLFKATRDNNHFEVENCLRKGAIARCRNNRFETPLLYASWKGYTKIVDLLLEYHANPNCTNNNNSTPLHYAAKFNHLEIIYSLLKYGAIFDIVSSNHKRPIDFAHDAKNTKIVNLLQLINRLFEEVRNKEPKIIKELEKIRDKNPKEFFAILNTRNIRKQTLIQVALDNDDKVIANSLLKMLPENENHNVQASEMELSNMILQNSNISELESDMVDLCKNPITRKKYQDLLLSEMSENQSAAVF